MSTLAPAITRARAAHTKALYEMLPGMLFSVAAPQDPYSGLVLALLSHGGCATADTQRIWVTVIGAEDRMHCPGEFLPLPRDTAVVRRHVLRAMHLVGEQ